MTESPDMQCPDCLESFASRRAVTQHTRYVHDGATLFGQRLVDGSEELIDPDREDRYWSEPDDDQAAEDEAANEGGDNDRAWALLLTLAALGLAILLRWKSDESESRPPYRIVRVPPFQGYLGAP